MSVDSALLAEVQARYHHAVLVFVDDDGYPLSVASDYRVDVQRGTIHLSRPAGEAALPPFDREVNVVFSHVHPQPGVGYDQRRYVSLWGPLSGSPEGLQFHPQRAQSWDEEKLPFFEYSEVTVPQARRYLTELGRRQGREVRPRLSFGWLALRTTRAPFLTAALVPVLLGVAVAAAEGVFDLGLAVLTVVAASFVHLGLNVANDVFDTLSGADAANTTPTQFSGGSRVVHYGLVRMRSLAALSATFYAAGIGLGLYLAAVTDFWPLFVLGAIGVAISVFYTAPPIRLVHRGVGEVAVAFGFGPIMTLGAYFVQAQSLGAEAAYLSLPVAILIALVLYVNEVPDRAGDAAAGKRTLPVRLPRRTVIWLYVGAVAATYGLIGAGAVLGIIARPAILALATIPLAIKVTRGLREHYDDPYALMPAMATNVLLHAVTGLLLITGYVIAIVSRLLMETVPGFLQ